MKSFSALVVVRQPPALVFATVRDRMTELVPALDDVEAIREREREQVDASTVRVVNEWQAVRRLPHLLARTMGGDVVGWVDHAEYHDDELVCRWRIEPSLLTDHVSCHGETAFEPARGGHGARIAVEGTFDLARGALAGVGRVLEGPVGTFAEMLVTTMIPRNTRAMLEAAAALAGAQGDPGQ